MFRDQVSTRPASHLSHTAGHRLHHSIRFLQSHNVATHAAFWYIPVSQRGYPRRILVHSSLTTWLPTPYSGTFQSHNVATHSAFWYIPVSQRGYPLRILVHSSLTTWLPTPHSGTFQSLNVATHSAHWYSQFHHIVTSTGQKQHSTPPLTPIL
jgi:hypothetical protein